MSDNLLTGIKQADKVEEVKDNLGGGLFGVVDSGIYEATIKHAYLEKSAKGSLGLHMEFELDAGQIYKESIYLTKQTGENYYIDKQDAKKKHLLPGFITADAIALFGAQKPISELKTEEMIVKIYNFDQKANVATPVPMLKELVGKTIKLAIKKKIEDKQVKDDSGKYVKAASGVREVNEIDSVFHPTKNFTVAELRAQATEPAFMQAWKDKWDGKVDNRATNASDGGTSAAGGAAAKPTASSLFK